MKNSTHNANPHLLIIGYVWPEPDSSAAGSRMMQLISLFRAEGWEITFASAAAESDYMANLGELHVEMAEIRINSPGFDQFIRELHPDIVLFDRFITEEQLGWRVGEQCPEAVRVLDTEDLHALRRARQQAVSEGRSLKNHELFEQETAKREIASILRSDLSLIISEAEMELLTGHFKVNSFLLHYLPFLLDQVNREDWPSFKSRNHFVTIGNFRHEPNRDAVRYLKKDVWPFIRDELPEAELHVYGAYPDEEMESLHQPDLGFHIKGRAEDARKIVSEARICLAPLRFGAGLKGKLIEAMQCGTPSVTTPIGAEGIARGLEWSGTVASEPEEIAAAATELYGDQSKWEKAQKNGVAIINSRFAREDFESDLIERIMSIQQNITEHRRENFTGQMLMYHTMASTKYMSKWIEEKERRRREKR